MANLLDTIRQNSQTMAQAPGETDQTQQVQGLLRAKSGKAVAAPAVGQSNLQEQSAVSQGQNQMQNVVQPQIATQNTQLQGAQAAQTQETGIQQAQIGQQRQFNKIQNSLQTQSLLNQFKQDSGKLDLAKNAAQVNQFGQALRLTNQQYIDQLQLNGSRARLDDANSFKQQLTQTTFGDNIDVLKQQLGDQSVLDVDKRKYETILGTMGVDQAWTIFNNDKKAQQQRAPYTAVGNIATAGAGAYGAYSKVAGTPGTPGAGTESSSGTAQADTTEYGGGGITS